MARNKDLPEAVVEELGRRYFGDKPSRYLVAMLAVCAALQELLVKGGVIEAAGATEEEVWRLASRRVYGRVKRFSRILGKAEESGEQFDSADSLELTVGDIVGCRVVLDYIDEVYKAVGLINTKTKWKCGAPEDYIENPQKSGYRSIHVTVSFDAPGFSAVPVEIQARIEGQDAWAEKTHELIYKRPGVPQFLKQFAKMQADCIYQVDLAMQLIRDEVRALKQRKKRQQRPTGQAKKLRGRR